MTLIYGQIFPNYAEAAVESVLEGATAGESPGALVGGRSCGGRCELLTGRCELSCHSGGSVGKSEKESRKVSSRKSESKSGKTYGGMWSSIG